MRLTAAATASVQLLKFLVTIQPPSVECGVSIRNGCCARARGVARGRDAHAMSDLTDRLRDAPRSPPRRQRPTGPSVEILTRVALRTPYGAQPTNTSRKERLMSIQAKTFDNG